MAKKSNDIELKQIVKDYFFTKNEYKLDDTFVLKDGKRHPFALICPGGGYSLVCSFVEGVPIAKRLNERGISAFILYYHVRNKALYPTPQDDVARAVKEILERADEYNLITENYSVWGSSAGGHLTASFGTDNMGYRKYHLPKPGALVLSYPVISMNKSLTHIGTHDNLLGKSASFEQEEFASIEKNVTADYPDTFIWCGDADKTVSPKNTQIMCRALEQEGIRYECHVYPDVDHGVGPGTDTNAEGWIASAIKFWLKE